MGVPWCCTAGGVCSRYGESKGVHALDVNKTHTHIYIKGLSVHGVRCIMVIYSISISTSPSSNYNPLPLFLPPYPFLYEAIRTQQYTKQTKPIRLSRRSWYDTTSPLPHHPHHPYTHFPIPPFTPPIHPTFHPIQEIAPKKKAQEVQQPRTTTIMLEKQRHSKGNILWRRASPSHPCNQSGYQLSLPPFSSLSLIHI